MIRTLRRGRLGRTALAIGLTLVTPIQDVLARGGGGGFRGGGGGFHGGGGGFHGGGGGGGFRGGGGGGGFHPGGGGGGAHPGGGGGGIHTGGGARPGGGGGRPVNPGGGHNFGGGGNHFGGGGNHFGGGGNAGIGNRGEIGNRGNFNQGNRNPFSGNQGNLNRGNFSGNRANIGNRTNIGNNVNVNNIHANNWHHGYNNSWHHGYWGGYGYHGWGGWGWGYPWGAAAIGGLVGWGLGSMYYSSGYASYSNPYYVETPATTGTYLDYSAPMQVSADTQNSAQSSAEITQTDPNAPAITPAEPAPSPEVQAALKPFDEARDAFKSGDYAQALSKTDEALKKLPNDAALHEFRALVLFAQGKYKDAAATIYSVLSVGPGWDWTTLSGMYGDIEVYTKQLRALEDYVKQNPDSADGAFVLAYHYLTCGHKDAAAKQLQTVARLLPNDPLAAQLLKMVGASVPAADQPPSAAGSPDRPALQAEDDGPPIEKSKVVGTWTAKRGSAVAIDLSLNDDDTFTWKVDQNGRKNVIEGKYEVEGNLLALTQKEGPPMVGRVLMADSGFNFKLVGSGSNDPGLDFKR